MTLEQCASESVGRCVHQLSSVLEHTPAARLHLVDFVFTAVALVGACGEGRTTGTVVQSLPFGIPMWLGGVPLTAAYAGVRCLEIPATCNVERDGSGKAGQVMLSVLIVDDSQAFREVARRLLERQGLVVLATVATAAEAVAQSTALHPDVALVDVNLAGVSGFEVARQIVRSGPMPETAVILTSTHAESEYADLLDGSPAAGFLPKERLSAAAIRAILSQGTG
jgi:CheY-like chemotaxis protein